MSEDYQHEAALFDAAVELPPDQRGPFLERACQGDPALRQRIESLLKACECRSDYLDSHGVPALRETLQVNVPLTEKFGDRIGRYKLLQIIGEGGCGVVYMAEQLEPVSRRVALKIIKLGMDTQSVIARFEAERQALALMDHPNIAKVLDAGATELGRPYFVMELVRGMKITEYCDETKLSTKGRLELFVQVCGAIQHAHQKGIIHRDIKPSNILVTVNDGVPVPKVIDFGIAKATAGQKLTDKTLFTAFEQFIGTPAYMSPEQAMLTSLDIDTRSDIYALGVLLYELLTGQTPFNPRDLLAAGLDEMRRTIREREPDRPSTRVSTLPGQELSTTAQRRGLEAPRLVSELRGDLDWIVMKCLEKDRARRYETANGLATDVQRHLNSEPVVACPPSRMYRFHKMVRRNKLAFAAGATVAVSLAAGLILTMVLLARERAARHLADTQEAKAREQAAVAEAVNNFLQEDLLSQAGSRAQANAGFTPDPNLTVRTAVERAANRIEARFQGHPLQEAAVRHVIAQALMGVGEFERAIPQAQKAWDLRREQLGPDDRLTLRSMGLLGRVNETAGRLERSLEILEEALRRSQAALGDNDPDNLDTMERLAFTYAGLDQITKEVSLREELFRRRETTQGRDHRDTLDSMRGLASSYARADKFDLALSLAETARQLSAAALPPDHPIALEATMTLANCFYMAGKYEKALPLYRESLERYQTILGPDSPATFWAMHNLALGYLRTGQIEPGLALAEDTLNRRRAKLGSDHPDTLASLDLKADALWEAKRVNEVLPIFTERLNLTKARFGIEHPDVIKKLGNLRMAYKDVGQPEKAAALLTEEWKLRKERFGSDHEASLKIQALLAMSFQDSGQSDRAIQLMNETVTLMKLKLGPDHRETLGSMNNLARFLEEIGRPQEARPLYEETLQRMGRTLRPADEYRLTVMKNLADVYRAAGQFEQALPLYEDRYARIRDKFGPEHSRTMDAMADLGSAYLTAEKYKLSLPLNEAMLTYRRKKLGPHDRLTLGTMCNLAIAYRETEDLAKSLPLFERALELMKLKLKRDDPYLRITMDNLTTAYERAGRSEEALSLAREGLVLRTEVLGAKHGETLWAMRRVVSLHVSANRLDEALRRQEELVTLLQAVWGPDHKHTLSGMIEKADILARMKRYDQALEELRAASKIGSVEAMNSLAWRLSTCSEDTLRNGRDAVDFAEQVLARAGGRPWSYLDTLAAAWAEAEDYTKACDVQREAIAACQDEKIKTALNARLKLYESRTPFREPW